MKQYTLCLIAGGLAIAAQIIRPFTPPWVFAAMIVISLAASGVSFWLTRRQMKRQELYWKMEQAFGIPNTEEPWPDH